MGFEEFVTDSTRDCGEHEAIAGELEVVFDEYIPDRFSWEGAAKRPYKWVKMARAFMLRTERTPQDRFNQAAHEVGNEMCL